MVITEKAQELGAAIRDTEEAMTLRTAEANLEKDQKSLKLITDFQNIFEKVQNARNNGESVADKDLNLFEELQEKVNVDQTIQAYFSAQQRFNQLLQQVNNVINQSLSGECPPSSCNGCSGCS